jgi:hypothetical protein
MADVSAGAGTADTAPGGLLSQRFTVPAGAKTLTIDFNVISRGSPPGFLQAVVRTPDQGDLAFDTLASSYLTIPDCFPDGAACQSSGWQTVNVDLSAYAGKSADLMLLFTVAPGLVNDVAGETHVLVDNVRFSTLWLDANTVLKAAHAPDLIRANIVDANELLSQAGINARLRDWRLLTDAGDQLLDLDSTPNYLCLGLLGACGFLTTSEQNALVSEGTYAPAPDHPSYDLHAYYVRSLTGLAAVGLAVGPDDYISLTGAAKWGVLLADGTGGDTLAHEVGHFLISPEKASSNLEHHVSDPANFMKSAATVPRTIVAASQSAVMNTSHYLAQ